MNIRKATKNDLSRLGEIFVYNNRLNYYPIFKDPTFSFKSLTVISIIEEYFGKQEHLNNTYVIEEESIVKGFIEINGQEICKLYVDPFFQSQGLGAKLITYATEYHNVSYVWVLAKNERALAFYYRHSFIESGEEKLEEGTTEFLKLLKRM